MSSDQPLNDGQLERLAPAVQRGPVPVLKLCLAGLAHHCRFLWNVSVRCRCRMRPDCWDPVRPQCVPVL